MALKMLPTQDEIACEIISTLSIDYHIGPSSVLASMRDRASTNNVALRTLKGSYRNIMIQFGDVLPFLNNEEIGSPATISKLNAILSDQSNICRLNLWLWWMQGKILSRQHITLKVTAPFPYHVFK